MAFEGGIPVPVAKPSLEAPWYADIAETAGGIVNSVGGFLETFADKGLGLYERYLALEEMNRDAVNGRVAARQTAADVPNPGGGLAALFTNADGSLSPVVMLGAVIIGAALLFQGGDE